MALIIATGSNIGDSVSTLNKVRHVLELKYGLVAYSRIYKSAAVEYEKQPDFFNQVIELRLPASTPEQVMNELLQIEKDFGRTRDISKGPRTLDLDIIFWGLEEINSEHLTIPHPRWSERSFVVRPLQELPFFHSIEKCFIIPESFNINAFPITSY